MPIDSKQFPSLSTWAEEAEKREALQYLIQGILPADNLILLSGVPKDAQKTFLAMTAALMVATGKGAGDLVVPKAEAVLYIYEEGDTPSTLARFKALCAGHGLLPVNEIKNLYFSHRGGLVLENTDDLAAIETLVREKNIKLVVFDTLAKCMIGDENNAQQCNAVIRGLNKLRILETSIMFVHHTRKENFKLSCSTHGTPEPDSDIRGSSALSGAYETHWAVRSYNTGPEGQKHKYLLIGGKEFPWSQHNYEFAFVNEMVESEHGPKRNMLSAQLCLGGPQELIDVEPRPSSRKGKGDL